MKIHLSTKGLAPNKDNAPLINRTIESAKEGSIIVFKDGKFPIHSTILQSKKVHWEGTGMTILEAGNPMTLLKVTGGRKSSIERITFEGWCSIGEDYQPKIPGLFIGGIVNMTDCLIKNMWGTGVSVIASRPQDASKCVFRNLEVEQCNEHGMYFQGGDANQCSVYDADIRDCRGIGIWDNSFLGNNFFGCMTHANGGGSFKAGDETDLDNQNSRAYFSGCYAEGGQPPVILCGHSRLVGGMIGTEIKTFNFAEYETH